MFKVILWDVDNTLLDFNAAQAYSLKARFKEYGFGECSNEAVERYNSINIYYWEQLEKGIMSKDEILLERFKAFFDGEGIDGADINSFNDDYENGIADKIFYNENSIDVITALKGRYKQYAVTNGSFSVQSVRLEKSGFDKLFDGVFISDCVGWDKPSIEYFSYVLEHIEPCRKDEILIVGDSLTSDMKGGNGIGIKTCWYNPLKKENSNGAHIDYEIRSLNDIYGILER